MSAAVMTTEMLPFKTFKPFEAFERLFQRSRFKSSSLLAREVKKTLAKTEKYRNIGAP
jgi:hypothetical protein